MTALATTTDYTNVTGQPVAEGDTRIAALLELASSAVLAGAYGQNITEAIYEDQVLRPHEGYCFFPQRPVSAVESVTLGGVLLVEGTDYRWTPGGNGQRAKLIRLSTEGRDSYWGYDDLPISTYTAGWNPAPGQIISIVCAMAKASVDNDGGAESNQETAGPFSESWSEPRPSGFALTASDETTLRRLCWVPGPTSVRMLADRP